MGSSTAAVLFYCVALSVVAAAVLSSTAAAEQPEMPGFVSAAALASNDATTTETSRKLIGNEETMPAPCPVRFGRMEGYDELGAKCKEEEMMKEECCAAFKKLACPHNELLNDVNNLCADDMFYFIHSKAKLPPGTILNNCNEGPMGIKC